MNYKTPLYIGLILIFIITILSFSSNPYDDVLLFIDDSDRIVHYHHLDNKTEKEYFLGGCRTLDSEEDKKIKFFDSEINFALRFLNFMPRFV